MEDGVYDAEVVKLDPWNQLHLNVEGRGLMFAHIMNPDLFTIVPGQVVQVHVFDDEINRVVFPDPE